MGIVDFFIRAVWDINALEYWYKIETVLKIIACKDF